MIPRLERFGPVVLTGILRRHSRELEPYDTVLALGRQWDEYLRNHVAPSRTSPAWRYGVTLPMADGDMVFSYFCGAPPPEPRARIAGFGELRIAASVWAVFPFEGHATEFRAFMHAAFASFLPQAGLRLADRGAETPEYVERYDWRFDLSSRKGGFDLLIPVAG